MHTNHGSAMKNKAGLATKRKNVQVVVRTRPLSEMERDERCKNVVSCDSVSKVVSLKTTGNEKNHGHRQFGVFDRVYGTESTQIQVYGDVVAPLMKEVLSGYNCTVFAYGQTGSGKTYTMEGRHDESGSYSWETDPTSGIIPRALHQIFTELSTDDIDFTVRVSYVELYNEQIYDLLSLSNTSQCESLRIFDDKSKGVSIVGAEEVIVRTRDEVYDLLRRGADKRRTAATMMNISSSRSHSVFTVSVMIREPGLINGEELLRQGKLNLVDLAGSENIGRSGATDKRAREAGNINASLLALGRVINALTTSAPHIPYRESKLTRILQDSLGGKTITTIIATLSPASSNFEESVNTLEYAQRAKNIKNNPEINQKITRRGLLKEYNEEIERLRRDLLAAREKHGIYLDRENYDNMVGEIEEKSAKVEDLEGQLAGQLQRVKTLLEDFAIMDENYQTVYNKCLAALDKLEKRKTEVEQLNKDLAQTKDNLNSANSALKVSENSFVRLRAQAYRLQTNCATFYKDLVGQREKRRLPIRRNIPRTNGKGKDRVNTANVSSNLVQSVSNIGKEVDNFNSLIDKTLNTFRIEAEKAQSKLQVFVSSCKEHMQGQLDQINHHSEIASDRLKTIDNIVAEQKDSTSSMLICLDTALYESQSTTEQFLNHDYKRFTATGVTPARRKTNSFMEDLVELPPSQELVRSQLQLCTPRRASFYRARDSILDSSDFFNTLVSPNTLKQNLQMTNLDEVDKLETIGENSERGADVEDGSVGVRQSVWANAKFPLIDKSVSKVLTNCESRKELFHCSFRPALGHLVALLLDSFGDDSDVNLRLKSGNLLCLLTNLDFAAESADFVAFVLPGVFSRCRQILINSLPNLRSLDLVRCACQLIINAICVSFSELGADCRPNFSSEEKAKPPMSMNVLSFRRDANWVETAARRILPQTSLLLSHLSSHSVDYIRYESLNILSQIREQISSECFGPQFDRLAIDIAVLLYRDHMHKTRKLARRLIEDVCRQKGDLFELHTLNLLKKAIKSFEKDVKNASDGGVYLDNFNNLVQIVGSTLLDRLFPSEGVSALPPMKYGLCAKQFSELASLIVGTRNSEKLFDWCFENFRINSSVEQRLSIAFFAYSLLDALKDGHQADHFVGDVLQMLASMDSVLEEEVLDHRIADAIVTNSAESSLIQLLLRCLSTFHSRADDMFSARLRVDVTYELLKWCSSSNFGVKNAAELALSRLAESHCHQNVSSLIQSDAQQIVFKLSMDSRDFAVCPRFPLVFAGMVSRCEAGPMLLPKVRSVVDELLLWLDRSDQKRTVVLAKALRAYLNALDEWFPSLAPQTVAELSKPDEEGRGVHFEQHFISSAHLPLLLKLRGRIVADDPSELAWPCPGKIVLAKAIEAVLCVCRLSKDFVYWKIVHEFMPRAETLLQILLKESQNLGKLYAQTATYKLQCAMLDSVPGIIEYAKISPQHFKSMEDIIAVYAQERKLPKKLRDRASATLDHIEKLKK
uniref:Kinesin motor domain-containing protein n=1 Tax=Globodera rostochiensis TaxID=31243 RepID=A0A914GYD2_GLORO